MLYAGLDVHLKSTDACVIDEEGNQVARKNLISDEWIILEFLGQFPERPKIVFESTRAWYWIYDSLIAHGFEVVVSDPVKTKAIASARIKHDRVDAHMLAQLLRVDLIATVYVVEIKTRALKELTRHRIRLVRDGTRTRSRVHNLLAKNNVKILVKDIFSNKGRELLSEVSLPGHHQGQLETYLNLYDIIREKVDPMDKEVKKRAKEDPRAQLLMSIPGVGPIVALTVLAEIGDISHFRSHRQLASYAGLIPILRASGGISRQGRITKQGSKWLRFVLVEAAQSVASNKKGRLYIYFKKRIVKAGYNKAIVATAHRILQFVFYVLRDEKPYTEQVLDSA